MVCTALALALFFALIREVGPQRALVITFVNPAVAVLLGVLLLDEPFTLGIALGLPLVLRRLRPRHAAQPGPHRTPPSSATWTAPSAARAEPGCRTRRASVLAMRADRSRCDWANSAPEYVEYHDEEWGTPLRGDDALFERLCLEAFQSGLSWITILRKRPAFR